MLAQCGLKRVWCHQCNSAVFMSFIPCTMWYNAIIIQIELRVKYIIKVVGNNPLYVTVPHWIMKYKFIESLGTLIRSHLEVFHYKQIQIGLYDVLQTVKSNWSKSKIWEKALQNVCEDINHIFPRNTSVLIQFVLCYSKVYPHDCE